MGRARKLPDNVDIFDEITRRVVVDPQRGCWLYFSETHAQFGYGKIRWLGATWKVHRLMWLLTRGYITSADYVLHACDVPNCCNPAHLFLGDHAINVRDCVSKGRHVSCKRRCDLSRWAKVVHRLKTPPK